MVGHQTNLLSSLNFSVFSIYVGWHYVKNINKSYDAKMQLMIMYTEMSFWRNVITGSCHFNNL